MYYNMISKSTLVIPSIDIKNNKLVRVVQGIPKIAELAYTTDPIEMAKLLRSENARCLHVVDFDGAWQSEVDNFPIIEQLIKSVVIPVQLGGGLRTYEKIKRALDAGACRVVLGTIAVTDQKLLQEVVNEFGSERVLVSVDIIQDKVVINGRKSFTDYKPIDLINKIKEFGLTRFVVTDVCRNGMMTGPNYELLIDIAKATKTKITASGGVKDISDLFIFQQLLEFGIDSIIIGRALYENKFACQKLWRFAENEILNK